MTSILIEKNRGPTLHNKVEHNVIQVTESIHLLVEIVHIVEGGFRLLLLECL